MQEWSAAGLAPSEFWQQTPASHKAILAGIRERMDSDFRLAAELARLNAMWSQCDPRKIPTIAKLMQKRTPRSDAADLTANARAWIAVLKAQKGKG